MNNSSNQKVFTEVIEHIVELLTPNTCFICNINTGLICGLCAMEIPRSHPVCYKCAKRSDDYTTCADCIKKTRLNAVFHRAKYENEAKLLINRLKFSSTREAARLIAVELANLLENLEVDVVSHIPTSNRRIRQRGFDQAELIAKQLSKRLALPRDRLFIRLGNSRQVGASKKNRQDQAKNSLKLKKTPSYSSVLIIDDVISSGATVEAAAQLLYSAGVRTIYAASFVRKL